MLTLGAGVGGAVLANGHLLRGHSGVAGHLGHLTVDPDGPVCVCGNRGCLETVFSRAPSKAKSGPPCIAAALPRSPACSANSPNWPPAAPSFKP